MLSMAALTLEQAEQLRKRVRGWRAAEVREREVRRVEGPMSPAESFEAGMELCELLPDIAGSTDPLRTREVDRARQAWRRLRNAWR
jgi:hypothetical protein